MSNIEGKRLFLALGSLLGAILGLLASFYEMLNKPSFGILVDLRFWLLCLLVFAMMQFALGANMNKPHQSRFLHCGILTIVPAFILAMSYPFSDDSIRLVRNLFGYGVLGIIVSCLASLLGLWLVAPFARLFSGYEMSGISDIPVLGYVFDSLGKPASGLIPRLIESSGFEEISRWQAGETSSETLMHERGELVLASTYQQQNNRITMSLAFFRVTNDSIERYSNQEEIADLRAQFDALLENWHQQGLIGPFERQVENRSTLVKEIQRGLGPSQIRILNRAEIVTWIKNYPRSHPYQFAIIGIILSAILTSVLGRLMTMMFPQ